VKNDSLHFHASNRWPSHNQGFPEYPALGYFSASRYLSLLQEGVG
jgi:hypothetical protein